MIDEDIEEGINYYKEGDYVKSKELCPWPKAKELNDIDESQLSGPLVHLGREIAKVKRIKIINAKK